MSQPTSSRQQTADLRAMRAALAIAERGLAAGEPPIGACVVAGGHILSSARTTVIGGPDATAHAEILALRAACRQQRTTQLSECTLYCTVEPCAMCLGAAYYAGIGQVFFGAGLDVVHAVTGREIRLPVPDGMAVTGGVLANECEALVGRWAAIRQGSTPPRPLTPGRASEARVEKSGE